MRVLTHAEAFQVILLQAADEGRADLLFGESLGRLREALPPFLIGDAFPDLYLEHPLVGDPFIDATVLFSNLRAGLRVNSPLAGEHGEMLDWFATASESCRNISCGFELDTKEAVPPVAAVHFQPREHIELVRPFCESVGEPDRAGLYLDMAARMPAAWPLSFFGLFRGRVGSPLRICGYLSEGERRACADDPSRLARVFEKVGFEAYHDEMLAQVAAIMGVAPASVDFQFDVYPDGSLGNTFAVDIRFGAQQPEEMHVTFESGPGAHVMGILEEWSAADGRWKAAIDATFARALPVELPDGGMGSYAFALMPQWVKMRWIDGRLQPSKLYLFACGVLVDKGRE